MTPRLRLALGALAALLTAPALAAPTAHAEHLVARSTDRVCPEEAVPADLFADVPTDHPYALPINCSSEYDVIGGVDVRRFAPERPVTRRQLAQVLYRLTLETGSELDTSADPGFTDDDHLTGQARDAVWVMGRAGVLAGAGGGRVAPEAEVRRDQVATALVRAGELIGLEPFGAGDDAFTDDDGSVHEPAIDALAAAGVTLGRGQDRRYGPSDPMSRQQLAVLLARVLDIAGEQGVLPDRLIEPADD